MESNDDDAALQLIKASSTLLSDLQDALPKTLWRPSKADSARGRVHSQVRQRDLDHILKLVRYDAQKINYYSPLMARIRSSLFKANRNSWTQN